MKQHLILLVLFSFFLIQCKKDDKDCWQAFDPMGFDVPGLVVCDKTISEAEAAYPQYWFYKSGEAKYCWKIQFGTNTYYTWDIPESMANRHMQENGAFQYSKINCNNFCSLEWHEKHKNKITNELGPVRLVVETIVSADSCSKLSVGKIVIIRETTDSVITRELIKKNP
jgi:hypothetical protein